MKKSKRQKIAAMLFSGAFAISAALGGVAMATPKDVTAKAAAPNTTDEFLIGSWISFYDVNTTSYDEQLKDLARSGVNWNPNPLTLAGHTTGGTSLNYSMTELNEMYKKYNVYFSAVSPTIASISMAEANKLVEEVTGNNLTNCNSYHVKDEPSAAVMEPTAEIFLNCLEKDPDRFPYVNLFPNYAGASNLGGSYEEYINNWVHTIGANNLEYLAYDHYPFTAFETVRSSYFSDLETVRAAAYDNGKLKTIACTQLGSWNGMVRPTADMARWNCNTFIAYGMKGLMHFNWVAPAYRAPADGGEGMQDFVLSADGEKTDLYEPMQRYNWQTRQLGSLLMQMDVAHAYHVGTVAQGAEALPKSFVFQPTSSSDNMIFSLAYGKNGEDIYVMVFNNELDGGKKTYNINVDLTAGVNSLTRYKTDSFETLPDIYAALPALGEERVDVSDGSFSVEMEPGEIAIYKLNGDISIKEPLKTPKLSLKSGTYIGEQELEITTTDEGAEIYYTTDGSYPTYTSARYTGPIKIGNGREFGQYIVKTLTMRGSEISDAVTGEYIIGDGSENVALGKPVTFTIPTKSVFGSSDETFVTDGNFDPYNVYGTYADTYGFAIVDLGQEYVIDKLIVKAFHDWTFEDVVLQMALDKDFTQGVYTVFNNDTDNSVGVGAGSDGTYTESGSGHCFKFSPVTARYIRFHNHSVNGRENYSFWEEIQAYTVYDEGVELLTNASDWKVTGGGTWEHTESGVSQTGALDRVSWDRSYTYTAKKFKNFILEGKFTMQASSSGDWGYVGFGLYKPEVNYTQSAYDKGFYAVVEPRGRALLWNGTKPELGPEDANIAGFALNSEFTLRVVSIGDTVSVSVNGKPVMYVRGEIFDREAGYISIHGGLIPVNVSSVKIIELDDSVKPLYSEKCLKEGTEDKYAVARFTEKSEVIQALPAQMKAKDTDGNEYLLNVHWSCPTYDCATTGYVAFTGEFVDLPEGLVNLYNVTAKMNVFVQPQVDKTELEKLVETAKSLNADYFTADSFELIRVKLEAAEAMLIDPYLLQSDLGVGVFQLYDAIYKYSVSTVDKTALLTAITETKDALTKLTCTEISREKIVEALAEAEAVYANMLSTPQEVADVNLKLERAMEGSVSLLTEKTPNAAMPPETYVAPKKYNAPTFIALGAASGALLAAGGIYFVKRKKKED